MQLKRFLHLNRDMPEKKPDLFEFTSERRSDAFLPSRVAKAFWAP